MLPWEPRDTEKWGANEVTLQEQFPNTDSLGLSEGGQEYVGDGGSGEKGKKIYVEAR